MLPGSVVTGTDPSTRQTQRVPLLPNERTMNEEDTRQLSTANARQVGGDHYASKAIQPWDYIIANQLGYLEGNIVKYVSRWQSKGGIDDLRKARHYIDKLIEVASK